MAKDKKATKPRKGDAIEAVKPKKAKAEKVKKPGKTKKSDGDHGAKAHPLEALSKLADHPLVSELLAAGALAAVAAIAEAGARNPSAVKSADSAKKAGKAAAAAIGARLLKEFNAGKKTVEGTPDKK